MRSCLTAILFVLLLISAVVGVGAVAMGQVRLGLCSEQTWRAVAAIFLGGVLLAGLLLLLLSLVNQQFLEKSIPGGLVVAASLLFTLAGVSLASFLTIRSARQLCPRSSLAIDVSAVCQGGALSGRVGLAAQGQLDGQAHLSVRAGLAAPALSLERLVVLGEQGQAIGWTEDAQRAWTPASLDEVGLVACAGPVRQTVLETCTYGGGIKIKRIQEEIDVRLVQADSGELLASGTLVGTPPACAPLGIQELPRLRGRVEFSALLEWAASALEVPATPAVDLAARVQALASPTATLPPEPTLTPTPQPEAKVLKNARLRRGPSTEDVVLGGLVRGQQVQVLGANAERTWLSVISPDGLQGWVFAELVELNVPIDQLSVVP